LFQLLPAGCGNQFTDSFQAFIASVSRRLIRYTGGQEDGPVLPILVDVLPVVLIFTAHVVGTAIVLHFLNKSMNQGGKQRPEIVMANKMILRQRDGVCVLQSRYVSAQGHDLLDVSVTMNAFVAR
jgi:hypothetical protein